MIDDATPSNESRRDATDWQLGVERDISTLTTVVRQQGEQIGAMTGKIDQLVSAMSSVTGRAGRIDLSTIGMVLAGGLTLWASLIRPTTERLAHVEASIAALDREVSVEVSRQHDREVDDALQRGRAEATMAATMERVDRHGALLDGIRTSRYTPRDAERAAERMREYVRERTQQSGETP